MTEPGRPLLLLDVDGPLNPYAARWFTTRVARDGYVFHDVGPVGGFATLRVALHPQHGRWLRELAAADDGFDLVWAAWAASLGWAHIWRCGSSRTWGWACPTSSGCEPSPNR